MIKKEKIFSLTSSDFEWDYYNGTGKGGSNRNKVANCVRCKHAASGAVGKSEDERSLLQNKKKAFKRMTECSKFKSWLNREIILRSGEKDSIEANIENELLNNSSVLIETENGKWISSELLKITSQDIKNLRD